MKKFTQLAIAGLMLGGVASAVVETAEEKPVRGATLTEIVGTKPVQGPKAFYLTINQNSGGFEYTTFTLHEDTGIRCITTPCPSTKETEFRITKTLVHGREGLKYEAIEVLKNIPPNVRMAARKLEVIESSMELVAPGGGGFLRREYWQVQVGAFAPNGTRYYSGQPKAIESEDAE